MPIVKVSNREEEPTVILAKELSRLSVLEREQVYEDVHGVSGNVNETPQLISDRTEELAHEIEKISHKSAFEKARQQSKEFVAKQYLQFLRADQFDAKKAARRMVDFFQMKLELFGEDKLGRHITLSDMKKDDLATIKSGCMQGKKKERGLKYSMTICTLHTPLYKGRLLLNSWVFFCSSSFTCPRQGRSCDYIWFSENIFL